MCDGCHRLFYCLLLSVYPEEGAISVAQFMCLCSFRGTPIQCDSQNSDDTVLHLCDQWMHHVMSDCYSLWHCRFVCMDQPVLIWWASTAWGATRSTSKHYRDLKKQNKTKQEYVPTTTLPLPQLMITVSSCRTVCIEKNSINSLALNENPHCRHQKMLVAGTVSVSSTGTR